MSKPAVARVEILSCNHKNYSDQKDDLVVTEEPLEIRINYGQKQERKQKSLLVTMRTPGNDFELVTGFLYSEGIIGSFDQIKEIKYCEDVKDPLEKDNVVVVYLHPEVAPDLPRLERHFYANSSCGVCGKTSIESLRFFGCEVFDRNTPMLSVSVIHQLSEKTGEMQTIFKHTGGIHAAALFHRSGKMICMREDIGRHNAMDKMVGAMLYERKMPLSGSLALVSGRTGYELVQKAIMAGIPVLASVGAPSSLAVELAEEYQMTLIGFLRNNRFNVYSGKQRIKCSSNELL